MSLTKAKGNMYEWCSHTHSYLTGECPHGCKYCYVKAMCARFPNMRKRYSGPLAFDRKQLNVSYDSPTIRKYATERGLDRPTIFIEHMNDLFAEGVPDADIFDVLDHCQGYRENGYVFQSKNPARVLYFDRMLPPQSMIGTTAESDYVDITTYSLISGPPVPLERLRVLRRLRERLGVNTFVTVEPVLRMANPEIFAVSIAQTRPSFVNVGADSKGKGLVEPTREELVRFLTALDRLGVTVKRKTNLERLMR